MRLADFLKHISLVAALVRLAGCGLPTTPGRTYLYEQQR
jgi:hypothetical protein